jgi:hypothetical protein
LADANDGDFDPSVPRELKRLHQRERNLGLARRLMTAPIAFSPDPLVLIQHWKP